MKQRKFDEQLQTERLKREKWNRWERMILTLCLAASMIIASLQGDNLASLLARWFA
jgi:hypothetical protein